MRQVLNGNSSGGIYGDAELSAVKEETPGEGIG